MEKKYIEFYNDYNRIVELKKIKGIKFEFGFLLIELRKKIKPFLDDPNEKKKTLIKERSDLIIKHCKKRQDGTADVLYTDKGNIVHKGLAFGECPEYDERMKAIEDQLNIINNEILNIDIDDIKKIKRVQCPKDEMNTEHWEMLEPWIEDFQI